MKPISICLLSVVLAGSSVEEKDRMWADRQGNTSKARFVRVHAGYVILCRGERIVVLSYFDLSDADRAYVRKSLAAKGEEQLIPNSPADVDPDPPGNAILGLHRDRSLERRYAFGEGAKGGMKKFCGGCGKRVPNSSRVGGTCPHCGTYWSFERRS